MLLPPVRLVPFCQAGFPFLLAYALAYVAIPAVRFLQLQATNTQVEKRNDNRRMWRDALRQGSSELTARLENELVIMPNI